MAFLKNVPRYAWWIAAGVLVVTMYSLVFFIPKSIDFAYTQQQTCVAHVALLPDIQRQSGGKGIQASLEGGVSLFGARLTSSELCVTPSTKPSEGVVALRMSPFGSFIASKPINVQVPAAPVAAISSLNEKSISPSKRLVIPLDQQDELHEYALEVDTKKTSCDAKGKNLECDVPKLELEHGTDYQLSLHRAFKEDDAKVGEFSVKTLTAVQMTGGSVTADQVVYDKPTEFRLGFDKPLNRGSAQLSHETDGKNEAVTTEVHTEGSELIVALKDQLPRNAQYQLDITEVEAEDQSTSADPIAVRFTTSGGPKVSGVSVGASGVAQNQRIIVTFDQPLKADVQPAKFARSEGAPTAVTKVADNQLAFTLQNAPLCAGFSLIVEKGLPSGSNDETSTDPWKFDARTVCGFSQVIGTSLQGRPIVAHYFGNGPKTILFNGAVHGNEASTNTTMQAWVAHLQANAHKIPADKRIVVVPNANPDGIANGTRNNSRNVNLARNFPSANWSASIDTATGVLPQGGGTAPLSEPEAQALANITHQLRPRLLVSFHSQGRLVGANQVGDSTTIGAQYASTVGYGTMFGTAEDVMGYSITGEYETWAGESLGIPAILIELPSHSGNYLNSQMNALNRVLAL